MKLAYRLGTFDVIRRIGYENSVRKIRGEIGKSKRNIALKCLELKNRVPNHPSFIKLLRVTKRGYMGPETKVQSSQWKTANSKKNVVGSGQTSKRCSLFFVDCFSAVHCEFVWPDVRGNGSTTPRT